MSREEIQNLLAGYATGTLNEAERRALFAAAIDDQDLFDQLAKEEALREALADPAARKEVIAALGPKPAGARGWRWLRQPVVWATAGGLAAAITGYVVLHKSQPMRREAIVAEVNPPSPPAPMAAPAASTSAKESPLVRQENARPRPMMAAPPPVAFSQPAGAVRESLRSALLPAPPAPPPLPAAKAGAAGAPTVAAPKAETLDGAAATAAAAPPAPAAASDQTSRAFSPPPALFARKKALAAGAAAIEYTLERRTADGAYQTVAANGVLHHGDSVRLRVASKEDGYLYLSQLSAAGWQIVASQRVEKGKSYELPEDGFKREVPSRLELWLALFHDEQDAGALKRSTDAQRDGKSIAITLDFE